MGRKRWQNTTKKFEHHCKRINSNNIMKENLSIRESSVGKRRPATLFALASGALDRVTLKTATLYPIQLGDECRSSHRDKKVSFSNLCRAFCSLVGLVSILIVYSLFGWSLWRLQRTFPSCLLNLSDATAIWAKAHKNFSSRFHIQTFIWPFLSSQKKPDILFYERFSIFAAD